MCKKDSNPEEKDQSCCADFCSNMWVRIGYTILILVVGAVFLLLTVDPLIATIGLSNKDLADTN